MTEPVVRLADNPILVAQAQRRLRRGQLVPALLIVGAMGFLIDGFAERRSRPYTAALEALAQQHGVAPN